MNSHPGIEGILRQAIGLDPSSIGSPVDCARANPEECEASAQHRPRNTTCCCKVRRMNCRN